MTKLNNSDFKYINSNIADGYIIDENNVKNNVSALLKGLQDNYIKLLTNANIQRGTKETRAQALANAKEIAYFASNAIMFKVNESPALKVINRKMAKNRRIVKKLNSIA